MTAHQKIVSDLAPGEKLLWCEEPGPLALLVGKKGLFGFLFFAVFLTFIGFIAIPPHDLGTWFFSFLAAFMLASFLFDLIGSIWTLYGITNKRLIILQPSMFSTVMESYYPPDIDFVKKSRRKSGAGNIVFAAIREKKGKRTETVEIGFFGLNDVDAVEAWVLALRNPKAPDLSPEATAAASRGSS